MVKVEDHRVAFAAINTGVRAQKGEDLIQEKVAAYPIASQRLANVVGGVSLVVIPNVGRLQVLQYDCSRPRPRSLKLESAESSV